MNKVAAVVVTYNRKELLKESLTCLLAQQPEAPHVIVVDNHSTDGTASYISEYVEQGLVEYHDTGANLGGAGGFAYGIRIAAEAGWERIWIMDDDCIPRADALAKLLSADAALRGQYGFLSSRALWTDGSFCRMNEQKLIGATLEKAQGIVRCRQATFVSLFLPLSTVREVGLPIKEFFIWGDDWEYTWRISSRLPSYYVSNSVVIHKTTGNTGSNIAADSLERLPRYRYAYRNEVYIARHAGWRQKAFQFTKVAYHIMRVLAVSENAKGPRIRTIVKGSLDGFAFEPEIEFVE